MQHDGTPSIRQPESGAALARAYTDVRQATEDLTATLLPEDCVVQTMPDVSPTKWHLAHTSWFFEEFILGPHTPGTYVPVHTYTRRLFNSYYNAVGPQFPRPGRGLLTRPTLDEVRAYRGAIDARVVALIEAAPPELLARLTPLVWLGLHHEQQHQELLLTDIKHVLAANPLMPVYREVASPIAQPAAPLAWLAFDGGLEHFGAEAWVPEDGRTFVFDNETPRHRAFLEPFELATRPVTNAEYLAFIEAGGYQQPEHWLALGWDLAVREGWQSPLYWFRADGPSGGWSQFTLHGAQELAPDETVCHLSYFEADAFARWSGARLPTEFEWEFASRTSTPVASDPPSASARVHPGVATQGNLFGDAWEWTSSSYAPYPGYQPAAGALGEYNGKFMCNQYVLRGGSCATPRGHVRATYRNFFPPEARWQFSGLRLARS